MASQITTLTIVYSNVYLGTDQRKHQSSAWLAFVWGIHWWSVNSPHKWPVTRKMFLFDDVIMYSHTDDFQHRIVVCMKSLFDFELRSSFTHWGLWEKETEWMWVFTNLNKSLLPILMLNYQTRKSSVVRFFWGWGVAVGVGGWGFGGCFYFA